MDRRQTLKYRPCIAYLLLLATVAVPHFLRADEPAPIELHSQRKVGAIDHCNVLLDASGDLLVKSASSDKTERQPVSLSCRREYDEKTLHLPVADDNALRGVRYYREASAKLVKGKTTLTPSLQPERRLVAVEIAGAKVTPFSPRGPLSVDELELLSAVGETLPLDELLPKSAVKVGESWALSDETLAVLLGLDEITSNSVKATLKDASPEFARLELNGKAEGKLFGAANQITLSAKCRFNRQTGRIDWFTMRLEQSREVSLVESGLDWTFGVQARIVPQEKSSELSEKALADLPLKPSESLLAAQYRLGEGDCQLSHDRNWFLTNHFNDQDEFHRLDRGQDIGMCRVSPQPQISPAKLPTLVQFQDSVHKALGGNFGEIIDVAERQNPAHMRILRVRVKGVDAGIPVRWHYFHVSDPEGRQVAFTFRIEEKNVEKFAVADEAMAESLRFLEKVEKK